MSREFLDEFIVIYESKMCLWLIQSKDYHNRIENDASYLRLVEKLRAIEPKASKDVLFKKLIITVDKKSTI